MTGAWRFSTDPLTCLRVWRWFPRVGRPEIAGLVGPCVRAGAVAVVGALASVAPWVPPAVPVVPVFAEALLPPYPAWVGVPGGGYGRPGAAQDIASAYGLGAIGWETYAGLSGRQFSTHPTSLTDVAQSDTASAWANRVSPKTEAVRSELPGADAAMSAPFPFAPPLALADIPVTTIGDQARQEVPEPATLALFGAVLVMLGVVRPKV